MMESVPGLGFIKTEIKEEDSPTDFETKSEEVKYNAIDSASSFVSIQQTDSSENKIFGIDQPSATYKLEYSASNSIVAQASSQRNNENGNLQGHELSKTKKLLCSSKNLSQAKHFLTNHLTRYSCGFCKEGFSQIEELDTHMLNHIGTKPKPFSCHVCTKTYSGSFNLIIHMRTHSGEKPFLCDICTKTFSSRSNLNQHIRAHARSKKKNSFMCDICNKSFSAKSIFVRHLLVHTGEKPFVCDICTKTYSSRYYLAVHMRTHTGEKPFACDICTETFYCRSNLHQHLDTHTLSLKKSFMCDLCSKKFSDRSNLIRHLRLHAEKKSSMCDFDKNNLVKDLDTQP